MKPQVLDRLLLSKTFLDRVRFQPVATHDRHTLASNIIAAHDAAELAIAAIADEIGCSPANPGKTYLMDYFEPIEEATHVAPYGRDYFRQLNSIRNQLKHQGLFPDSRQWARVAESVHQHLTKWCSDYLGIHFGDLDQSVMLLDPDVKRLYDEAKVNLSTGDFQKCLEQIALALARVFKQNSALGELTAGKASSDDAIRLTGFGVHANDFLSLQEFLPLVETYGKDAGTPKWKQSQYGHPGNWRESTAQFCLRTFLDVTIKLQDVPWVPGAFIRSQLYDEQIEAIEEKVEIWTTVRVDSSGQKLSGFGIFAFGTQTRKEIVKTLKRGELFRAGVSIAAEPTGDAAKDAFLGGGEKTGNILNVIVLASEAKDSMFGQVLASQVKVTCVPKDSDFVKRYFPGLPVIPWQPE